MYQQLWGYKVEEKLYLGVHEQKWLNTTGIEGNSFVVLPLIWDGGGPLSLLTPENTSVSFSVPLKAG
jgi:hypothetical protein